MNDGNENKSMKLQVPTLEALKGTLSLLSASLLAPV